MKKFTEYKEPEILLEDNTIDIITKCFESINYETHNKIDPWKNDIKIEVTDKTINILESFIEDKITIILLIVGIIMGYIIPNVISNKNQYKIENDSLKLEIEKRIKENKKLDSLFTYLSKERIKSEINIEKRNEYINEEINDVDSWDNNKRIHFFSEYFKSFN